MYITAELDIMMEDVHAEITYNASCSTPMPTRRPAIAPTAILGMNRPAGTYTMTFWSHKTTQY